MEREGRRERERERGGGRWEEEGQGIMASTKWSEGVVKQHVYSD